MILASEKRQYLDPEVRASSDSWKRGISKDGLFCPRIKKLFRNPSHFNLLIYLDSQLRLDGDSWMDISVCIKHQSRCGLLARLDLMT